MSPIALEALWSSIVSIFVIGGVIGSFAGSASADKWGRKGSIIITDILGLCIRSDRSDRSEIETLWYPIFLGLIASVCFILSKEVSSVEALLIGRFIIGLSSGLSTAVTPMYLTELAPLRLRGATGVMCPLGWLFLVFSRDYAQPNSVAKSIHRTDRRSSSEPGDGSGELAGKGKHLALPTRTVCIAQSRNCFHYASFARESEIFGCHQATRRSSD